MKNKSFLFVALLIAAAFCQCPQGSYSSDGTENAQGGCISCPIDKTTISAGTMATDSALACTINLCPKGSYSSDGTENAQGGCISCGSQSTTRNVGTASDDDSVCGSQFCPRGTYSSNGTSLGDRCISCQNGKTTIGIGTIGTDQNSVCVINTQPCPKGSFSPDGTDFDSCTPCSHGQTTLRAGTKYYDSACYLVEPCLKGTYSLDGTNLDMCYSCGHGKDTVSTGTLGSDDSVCTVDFQPCPKGSFRLRQFWRSSPSDYNTCKPCNSGKTTVSSGTEGYGMSACSVDVQPCPKNSFSSDGTDYTGCIACPPRRITVSIGSIGQDACKPFCYIGFYSDDGTGNMYCGAFGDCPDGKWCSSCPRGQTTEGLASVGADSCFPIGFPKHLLHTIGTRQIRSSNYFGGRIFPVDFYWSGHSTLFPNGSYKFCTDYLEAETGYYNFLMVCPNGQADLETDQQLVSTQNAYSANQKKILLSPTDLSSKFEDSTFELRGHTLADGREVQIVTVNYNFSANLDSSLPLPELPRLATPMDLVGTSGYSRSRAVQNKTAGHWDWRAIYLNEPNIRYSKITNTRYFVVTIN